MTGHDLGSATRIAARRSWPIRVFRLGREPVGDLARATTAQGRLEMMWPLALEAWSLAGLPVPDYSRRETPVRVLRRRGTAPRAS